MNASIRGEFDDKMLGGSPPLELRRPGSVPRTVVVPHGLQSPQDRSTGKFTLHNLSSSIVCLSTRANTHINYFKRFAPSSTSVCTQHPFSTPTLY